MRTQKELIEAQHKQIAALEHSAEMQRKRIYELEHEGQNMKNDIGRLVEQKGKLHKDLEQATDHIISMEEKVFKSNKISLEETLSLNHDNGDFFFDTYGEPQKTDETETDRKIQKEPEERKRTRKKT